MQVTYFYHVEITPEYIKLTRRSYISVGNYLANKQNTA